MLSLSLPGPRLSLAQALHSSWAAASELGAQKSLPSGSERQE